MGLDILNVAEVDSRLRVSGAQHLLLSERIGGGQSVACTAAVHGAAAHYTVDRIPVRDRLGEALQHDDPAAFAPHKAVGAGVKGETAAIRRKGAELRDCHHVLGCEDHIDSAYQRQGRFTAAQALKARCKATTPDAHAASIAVPGPRRPSV